MTAIDCFVPPPCNEIGPASILFTGMAGGVVAHPSDVPGKTWSEGRFQIGEVFEGIRENTKEAVVSAGGDPFQKGHSYLIHAQRANDGGLFVAPCTNPGEIGGKMDERTGELLSYLRERKAGNVDTSLAVTVNHASYPITGAEVAIANSVGSRKARTDSDGRAYFKGILAGHYSVTAALTHYRRDPGESPGEEIDVLPGTCESALIDLSTEMAVTGVVRDSEGAVVANLALELITAPQNSNYFEAKTDSEGRFRIESVSPGKYLLGSNIIGLNTSIVLPTFYPGQKDRSAAVPIEVKLGESIELPPFNLPDYGGKRTIQICVVDENGKLVSSANIKNGFQAREPSEGFGGLPDDLVTDETGCVKTFGYARVTYRVSAMLVPGRDTSKATFSGDVVIGPGTEPRTEVLKLTR